MEYQRDDYGLHDGRRNRVQSRWYFSGSIYSLFLYRTWMRLGFGRSPVPQELHLLQGTIKERICIRRGSEDEPKKAGLPFVCANIPPTNGQNQPVFAGI